MVFPENMLSNRTKIDEFIDVVFDFRPEKVIDSVAETSIMSPKNSSADVINNIAVTKFPGNLIFN